MKKLLIGCGIIKTELEQLLENNKDIDVIWMSEDLHDHPDKLRDELQKAIDAASGYDEILLSFGLCGNALVGITATHCDIIYPKTDDCISALLCDNCRMPHLRKDSVFVSRGWLSTKNNFKTSHEKTIAKYGEKRAEMIYKMMYEHYKNVIYMKTENEIEEELAKTARNMAQTLKLDLSIEPATTRIYEKLLNCEADDIEIKRLKKGQSIQFNDFIK